MKITYIIGTISIIFYQAMTYSNAIDDCPTCLRSSYETQKGSIENFVKMGNNSKSVFAESFETLVSGASSLSPADRTTVNKWLEMVEKSIIRNGSVDCPTQKVLQVAMRMDQLFIINPSIGNAIKYQNLGTWGPVLHFGLIANEMNIGEFLRLSTTKTGLRNQCLIQKKLIKMVHEHEVLRNSVKHNKIPCAMNHELIQRLTTLHTDIPFVQDRLVFKAMEIPGADMTINQYQTIARMFYSSKSYSCRRLKDMFAGYDALSVDAGAKKKLETLIWNKVAAGIPAGSSLQSCIDWWSSTIGRLTTTQVPGILKNIDAIFWNCPFGSFYENLIIADCQMDGLKRNVPEYYK